MKAFAQRAVRPNQLVLIEHNVEIAHELHGICGPDRAVIDKVFGVNKQLRAVKQQVGRGAVYQHPMRG